MAENYEKNSEVEYVPPSPSNFVRAINNAYLRVLKESDSATVNTPTLLTKAKTLVERKSFIALFSTKEVNDG
jgi:hypothetical protein